MRLPLSRILATKPVHHPRCRLNLALENLEDRHLLDVAAPAILQVYDGSDKTIEHRAADIFMAGYGVVQVPPPGRADTGNQSVGYDVYDRFDLGGPGSPTLYGTQTGFQAAIQAVHQTGAGFFVDYVANQNGYDDQRNANFVRAGGYPGFVLSTTTDPNGDFHDIHDTGDINMRLAGLIDIAQEKNYQYVRSPVPGYANNIPAGTTPWNNRLANVPDPNNTRLYPDRSLNPISVYDPTTGEQNIHIYPFNTANPSSGTPVSENATGLLQRYAQWLVQVFGVDGFRIDAAKNMPQWFLNYVDRAVYRESPRRLLNGAQEPIFSYSEVYDGNRSFLQGYIRKDINPADPGRIGGNRDVLDFPLYFAMNGNLTNNGFQNDWRSVVNAGVDPNNHGANGVSFVNSQDVFAPYLSNVAYAYTLLRPGNAIVYFNAKEFGTNRAFPKDGRGDALGGLYGNAITTLLNIRNTHGRGNYIQRDLEKEINIYELNQSALVVLSNRLDGGYDSRTVHTNFSPGTPLIELTGNAANPVINPFGDFPQLVVVNADGTVNLRAPRNRAPGANGTEHDLGYFVYGPSGPQGNLTLTNVDHVIPGENPTAATNGTARLTPINVITAPSFQIQLNTNQVNLLGFYRDREADGDNALFKIDDGVDVTGRGFVSTDPTSTAYSFQNFLDVKSPGYNNADGNGRYVQTIDTSRLSAGYHYITVRAYRHRAANEGPAIYTDFRTVIYVDHGPSNVQVVSFAPLVAGVNENQQVVLQSTDLLANSVHVFLDLPAGLTDAQVRAMIGAGSQATQTDRNLFTKNFYGLTNGYHVLTVVSFQPDGSYGVERLPGFYTSTIYGAGLGDLNFDGQVDVNDVNLFAQVLGSGNAQFNPAADMNGDGVIDNSDLLLLYQILLQVGADPTALAAYNQLLGPPAGGFTINVGQDATFSVNQPATTSPALSFTWDINGLGLFDVSGANPTAPWSQLANYGITDVGTYPITTEVTDGTNVDDFATTLTVVAGGAPGSHPVRQKPTIGELGPDAELVLRQTGPVPVVIMQMPVRSSPGVDRAPAAPEGSGRNPTIPVSAPFQPPVLHVAARNDLEGLIDELFADAAP
jgi:glycosidase